MRLVLFTFSRHSPQPCDGFPFKPWRLQLRAFPGCGGVLRSAGDLRPWGVVSALSEMMDRRSRWINNPASLLLKWDTFHSSEGPRQDWVSVAHSSIHLFIFLPSSLYLLTFLLVLLGNISQVNCLHHNPWCRFCFWKTLTLNPIPVEKVHSYILSSLSWGGFSATNPNDVCKTLWS